MNPSLKRCSPAVRTLHIYLSLAAFTLLMLFTLTGWMMAHQDQWGLNQTTTTEEKLSFAEAPDLLLPENRADLLVHLEFSGRLVENGEDFFQVQRPGHAVFVEIHSEDQTLSVIQETRGLSGWLFDLHRNRNSRGFAMWMQDLTAILCLGVSLTGLFLWLPLTRRRTAGLAALCSGLLITLIWALAA